MTACTGDALMRLHGAVVRKPPKNEPAGREAQVLTGGYGDLLAMKWPPGELEWAVS